MRIQLGDRLLRCRSVINCVQWVDLLERINGRIPFVRRADGLVSHLPVA